MAWTRTCSSGSVRRRASRQAHPAVWLNILIFTPIFAISWVILLPVDGTSTGGLMGIERFTIGNIGQNQQDRLAAHLILAWLFTCASALVGGC